MNVAIYGYGNIGKGIESEVEKNPDINLVAIFTRRQPCCIGVKSDVEVLNCNEILSYKEKHGNDCEKKIDVLIICGGSANDLPEMTAKLANDFNVIDTFDTHANIPKHFAEVDEASAKSDHLGMISAGWDPGLFSINRVCAQSILPNSKTYTFWGKGISQGHSNAIRDIEGVADARQYTIPCDDAISKVRSGCLPELTTRDKHIRECFVVAKPDADKKEIEKQIVNMPKYFDEYKTFVHFITQEELDKDHSELPHGGFVICSGSTGFRSDKHKHIIEYDLKLDSNPEFTSSAVLAFSRALWKMYQRGQRGCITVLDVAPADMSPLSPEELRQKFL